MQFTRKIYCSTNLFLYVTEQYFLKNRGYTISLTRSNNYEIMIFLARLEDKLEYEVRVYKASPKDRYIPNKYDSKIKRYEENDQYVSFFFHNFNDAHKFITISLYLHEEFEKRPIRKM